MRPKIPMQIPPLTEAANVTVYHLSGSGKLKQSLGYRDIYGTFKTMLCHRQTFFQNIRVLSVVWKTYQVYILEIL